MGNKSTSQMNEKYTQYFLQQRNNLQPCPSEESYLPMPLTMRRTLMEGRKFRHVTPSKKLEYESMTSGNGMEKIEEELDEKQIEPESKQSGTSDRCTLEVNYDEIAELPIVKEEERDGLTKAAVNVNHKTYVEPIVTVLSFHDKGSYMQSTSKLDKSSHENTKSFPKSPNTMNRRYSLIDMRTGLKKSKFTLELEEKLKQSKLELGFDADLNDWKEFSYKMVNPKCKKKVESLQKGNLNFGLDGKVGKGLENVCLKDPLQYCAQNCQILGLCSIRRPETLPKTNAFEESAFKDEIRRRHELDTILNEDHKKHPQKQDCDCQYCMLAYLTEMGFPSDEGEDKMQVVPKKKEGRSPADSPASCRRRSAGPKEERIRIIENENRRRSIEICFKENPSAAGSSSDVPDTGCSQTSVSTVTFDGDCTNKAIKRMFRENRSALREIFSSPNKSQQILSLTDISSNCHESDGSKEAVQVQRAECRRRSLARRRYTVSGVRRTSSSALATSNTSSMSSIMSYKRVRQMFQTIIERRSATRRRPRKNIHKFKEMEDLGLGEVKNNRWYPSEHKALSIWNGIHQSVQGIQAEFKKYPKTSTKGIVD